MDYEEKILEREQDAREEGKEDGNIHLQYFYNNKKPFNGLIENKIFDLASFNKTPQEYAVYLRLKELTKKVIENNK